MPRSQRWKYAVGGVIGSFIGGNVGILAGLYVESKICRKEMEKRIYIYDHTADGKEGLCVQKNEHQVVCAYDYNLDGAVDIVLYEDGRIKDVKLGEEKCLVPIKSLEQISKEPTQNK